jgi:hypothetical protein
MTLDESVKKLQDVISIAEEKQKECAEIEKRLKVADKNSLYAHSDAHLALMQGLSDPEVLSERVWQASVYKQHRDGRRSVVMKLADANSTFAKMLLMYSKLGEFFWHLQEYVLRQENPRIYLNEIDGSIAWYFSLDVPWEKQIEFLKENHIHFSTLDAWQNPKRTKRLLKQLDAIEQ